MWASRPPGRAASPFLRNRKNSLPRWRNWSPPKYYCPWGCAPGPRGPGTRVCVPPGTRVRVPVGGAYAAGDRSPAARPRAFVLTKDQTSRLSGDKSQPRDRHSHKQENVKGQVWTTEKAPQEERDNFLSARTGRRCRHAS